MDLLSFGAAAPTNHSSARKSPRIEAATLLARRIGDGKPLTRADLREAMIHAYGAEDAAGAWSWKDAYDAAEAAETRHLLKVGRALIAADPMSVIRRLAALQSLGPSLRLHTEESLALQQFSTPAPYAYAAFLAADIAQGDLVLEPSAGQGSLAVFAKVAGARRVLNEIDEMRANALKALFDQRVHGEDAAQIDDRLADPARPTVVLMNPPFAKSVSRADHSLGASSGRRNRLSDRRCGRRRECGRRRGRHLFD